MLTKQTRSNRFLVTLGITAVVFPFVVLTFAYGHGDKKHDDGEKDSTAADTAADGGRVVDSAAQPALQNSIDSVYALIAESYKTVEPMLKNSCFDCHTSQTVFPWYHSLPLIGGWMDGHLEDAREHLDLDQGFPFGGHATQLEQLDEIKKVIEEGEMPIFSYRIMHWGKLIEGKKQDTLFTWISNAEAAIKKVYANYDVTPDTGDDADGDGHHDDNNDDNDDDSNDHDDD